MVIQVISLSMVRGAVRMPNLKGKRHRGCIVALAVNRFSCL